jgi:hypothetical protein
MRLYYTFKKMLIYNKIRALLTVFTILLIKNLENKSDITGSLTFIMSQMK